MSSAAIEAERRDRLCPAALADTISYDWSHIGLGIALAGGAYPVILCAMAAAIGAGVSVWNLLFNFAAAPGLEDVGLGLLLLCVYAIIGALIGFAWSGMLSAATLPVVYLVAWSLRLRTGIVSMGAFGGGLVGFIAVLPLTLALRTADFQTNPWLPLAAAVLGPGFTTILGQLGGAWGGNKSREADAALDWRQFLVTTPSSNVDAPAPLVVLDVESRAARMQFGIRHLLWTVLWVSMLLGLIRFSGISFEFVLPLLGGWLLYQMLTLAACLRLSSWRTARAARLNASST
jgi:hypothetical protein